MSSIAVIRIYVTSDAGTREIKCRQQHSNERLSTIAYMATNIDGKSVGFTLSRATKALRESRGIALLYFRPLH